MQMSGEHGGDPRIFYMSPVPVPACLYNYNLTIIQQECCKLELDLR
jgi:hypothetical protein